MKVLIVSVMLISNLSYAKKYLTKNKITYQTFFGNCPARSAGSLTIELVKLFEESRSLFDLKKAIVENHLDEKYYLSSYQVKYDPMRSKLRFYYDCPNALMKVQIYKKDGNESYAAILVDTGKLYDPSYEVLLRSEKKLIENLPFLALPIEEINQKIQNRVADMILSFPETYRKKISEIIIGEDKELTIIYTHKNRPTSVFFGEYHWIEKSEKFQKIVKFMEKKNKIPSIINMTSAKKVVVKFPDDL